MSSNNKNSSQRKVFRITNILLVYMLKLIVNLGLVLGLLMLTVNIKSSLFSAITFLCACLFDIATLYVVNNRMDNATRISQAVSLVVMFLLIAFLLYNLVYIILMDDFFIINIKKFLNFSVIAVGAFSTFMEIMCNIPYDD